MKIISVVGARPQFIKLAPMSHALTVSGQHHVIVHTGQHYDAAMSEVFFRDLAIPSPDIHLGVGSGSHGAQTGRMLAELEPVLDRERPDWVIAYGDTNSTIAAALAAIKLRLPLAHLEAGLRSYNRRMPEEHNRVLTDHAADLLLVPTALALSNLHREGLGDRAFLVGDVMTDVCLNMRNNLSSRRPTSIEEIVGTENYVLATIHRPANTDDPERLRAIITALRRLELPVVLTAHPRLAQKANDADISLAGGSLLTLPPLAYPDMVAAVIGARAVITDSGGLQKEAYLLNTVCTTLRSETEWPETLRSEWNVLVPGVPDDLGSIVLRTPSAKPQDEPYGDGHAADAVLRALILNRR